MFVPSPSCPRAFRPQDHTVPPRKRRTWLPSVFIEIFVAPLKTTRSATLAVAVAELFAGFVSGLLDDIVAVEERKVPLGALTLAVTAIVKGVS